MPVASRRPLRIRRPIPGSKLYRPHPSQFCISPASGAVKISIIIIITNQFWTN